MGSEKCSPAVQAFAFLFELISQCYCSVFVAFLLWISPWKDLAFVVRLFCNLAHLSGVCWGRPAPHPQKIQGGDLSRARARSSKERRGWRWRGRQPSIAAASNVRTSLTAMFYFYNRFCFYNHPTQDSAEQPREQNGVGELPVEVQVRNDFEKKWFWYS